MAAFAHAGLVAAGKFCRTGLLVSNTAWRLALTFLVFSTCGGASGAEEDWTAYQARMEQARERLRQEAISLFAVVLDGNLSKRSRCQIASEWSKSQVEEDDAKQVFGVEAHATLGAPDHGTKPAEVIDPKGASRSVFCGAEETGVTGKEQFAAFKKAFEPDKPTRLQIAHWSYSFPVFNKDFTRAEFGVVVEWRNWWAPGENGAWEGSSDFYIYEKRNGAWEQVGTGNSGGATWEGSAPPLE
jgi:hypothetical protein